MRLRLLLALSPFVVGLGCGTAGPAGPKGEDGTSCTVVDNNDGTKTITCPDTAPVTIANGSPGSSCTVKDNGDGTSTITCTDNTTTTVKNGTSCSVVDNGDGTKTITCPDGMPVTVNDGTNCSIVDAGGGSSVLSCSDGTRQLLDPPMDANLDVWENLPGVVVNIISAGGASNGDGSFAPGDKISVTFKVTTKSGRILPLKDLDSADIWVAGPSSNYQHIIPSTRDALVLSDVATKSKLNDDGSYTYTFDSPIPTDYGVPINDTTKFTDGELTGPLDKGTYTVAMAFSRNYFIKGQTYPDANSATYDFGLNTTTLSKREVVGVGNCNACHIDFRMHEGKFRTPDICITCHTSGAEDMNSTDMADPTPQTIDFKVMVHKLHNGAHLPSVQGLTTAADGSRVYGTGTPYVVGTKDFSGVNFPSFPNARIAMPKDSGYSALSAANKTKDDNVRKGVTSCFNCHGDPDGMGPLAAPAQGNNAYAEPGKASCGSCHDDLDYAKPYVVNGFSMPANAPENQCKVCHVEQGTMFSVRDSHVHPVLDPVTTPTMTIALSGVSGATGMGGRFLPGDAPSVSFTIKDAANMPVPITYFDSFSLALSGPTQNRQVVIPGALTATPFDVSGRLAAAATTNKGTMSKIYPLANAVSDTFVVDFTSSTAFNISGVASGALGSSTLSAGVGTNPSGSSISNIVLSPTAVAQTITIAFTGPLTYTVTGSSSGAMGSGALPASTSNTQRFTSLDGTVAFNIAIGTTAAAAGNNFYMTVVKTPAPNPALFAIVAGRTAFAATDRFYFDMIAPAASYTVKVPMDLQLEYLGDADGSANQVFTAANLPVYYGRQTLLERTALVGAATTTNTANTPLARYVFVNALDAGLAANDYIVLEDGTANEEYARVSAIDTTLKRLTLSTPLRYAHNAGASVQEATMAYRQEGLTNHYTLNAAAGTLTLSGSGTMGNAYVLSYRTDGRFGWKRKLGDSLQAWYYAPLAEAPGLDETWGDWRGKPLVDGTYTVALWGYRSVEYKSGSAMAYEWQTYRDTTSSTLTDFLYGASSTTLEPYSKLSDTQSCNTCHDYISFHGGGRLSADTCLMCHTTPGPAVNFRTVLHEIHAETFPAMPNGAGECAKCHTASDVFHPTNRSHPTAQGKPALDWGVACTGCHSSSSSKAHAETMTSASGYEACETCHGDGRDLEARRAHQAR